MFLTTRYFYISEKFKLISLCLLKKMRLNEVKKEEQEVLETRSIPLRNYLMKHVMPTLSQGLVECTKIRPEDPVDFLVRNVQYQRRITLPPPPLTSITFAGTSGILFLFLCIDCILVLQAEYLFKNNPLIDQCGDFYLFKCSVLLDEYVIVHYSYIFSKFILLIQVVVCVYDRFLKHV